MRLVELMMQVRSDVQLRIERSAEMTFFSNGQEVTDAIKGMDLAYIAELDRLLAERTPSTSCGSPRMERGSLPATAPMPDQRRARVGNRSN